MSQTKRPYLDSREDSNLTEVTQKQVPRLPTQEQLRHKSPHGLFLPLILGCPYSASPSQVHWSGGGVHYILESQPPGPFDVDAEGTLYVTKELDREAQAEVR